MEPLRRYPTQSLQSLLIEKVPLMAIALVGSAVAYFAQQQAGAVSNLEVYPVGVRISNALVSYVIYLRKTVWPMDLSVFYSHPDSIPAWKGVGAALLLVAISIVAVRAFRRQPAVLVGWLWFLITFVPAIGLVQVGVQSMADRFTYIPLIGIYIAAVWSVPENLRVSRAVLAGIAVAVVAAYAAVARHQLSYWKDSVTLWTRATELTLNVDSYRAHLSLGDVLSTQGRASEAIGHFTEAARLKPDSVEARHKLGLALAGQGRIDEAATAFVEAIRLAPQSAAAHADLGLAFLKQGKNNQAIEQYTEAVRLDPNLAETQNSLGALLAQNGRMRDSIPHFSKAVRLNPDFEVAHLNLAIAFVNVDQLDDAEREFKEVHRLNPGNAIAARALGDLARRARRF
jgi:tetratricopeptide (TPR) repeat protein